MTKRGVRVTHDRISAAYRRYGKDSGEMSVCRLIEEDAGVSLRVGNWFSGVAKRGETTSLRAGRGIRLGQR